MDGDNDVVTKEKWRPYVSNIAWYLQRPRKLRSEHEGASDFTFKRVLKTGNNKRYPNALKKGWEILYRGEIVITVDTMKEVREFIREKLEN